MNATHALGWALVHFLWQGAALATLLGVALAVIRPAAARTRYTIAIVTLGAMLVIPVATSVRLYEPAVSGVPPERSSSSQTVPPAASSSSPSPAPRPAVAGATLLTPLPSSSQSRAAARFALLRDRLEPALPWLVVVWILGVLILSARLA